MSATRQVTETTVKNENTNSDLVLRLSAQPTTSTGTEPRRHVAWTTETVDNEHLGKKKSKCCCIYKKPRNWQDSSSGSDSDCETGHCRGHVEQKGGKKHERSNPTN